MSDLIDRRKALDGLEYEMKYGAEIDRCGLDTAYDIIENIPSAEPERTAKVKVLYRDESVIFGHCECGQAVNSYGIYCHHCGARLEWE